MQCRLRDQRSRLFSLGLRPCPLRTEIPPDSLNLLIMLCTVEGEISKSLPIFLWGTLFLNISIIFSRICWQTGDPRPIFAPKGLDLSWMLLLYQIIITITCWHHLFQITSLLNQFTSLLALNCSCPNFFWNVLQVWMTGKDVYLQMTWSWPDKTWNILCSYCLQWNTSQSKFRNHYFLFLFAFSILSQLFLIWVVHLLYIYIDVCKVRVHKRSVLTNFETNPLNIDPLSLQFQFIDSLRLSANLDFLTWKQLHDFRHIKKVVFKCFVLSSRGQLTLSSVDQLTVHYSWDEQTGQVLNVTLKCIGQCRQFILLKVHRCWVWGRKREREIERMVNYRHTEFFLHYLPFQTMCPWRNPITIHLQWWSDPLTISAPSGDNDPVTSLTKRVNLSGSLPVKFKASDNGSLVDGNYTVVILKGPSLC